MQLGCHQRSGQGRVGIAVDQHHVRLDLLHDRLERLHHGARHRAVTATADLKIIGGRRDSQLVKKHIRHRCIEMLPGVNQFFLDQAGLGERID